MTTVAASFQGLTLMAIAMSAACVPAPVWAQNQPQAVAVTGEAARMCVLGQVAQGQGGLSNFDAPSGSVFGITALADPTTLTTQAASINLSMDAMCNGLHRVSVASDNNGLWRHGVASATSGFGSAVPYRANLVWGGQQSALFADATQRQLVQDQVLIGSPVVGAMLIEFSINAGATNAGVGSPLLAGEYSDVLRITVEPQ